MKAKNHPIASFILGFAVMLFSGVFYAWSLFIDPLKERFPDWSAKATSLNFTVFIITFCLGGMLGARLTKKLGQPKVARVGAVLILAGGLLFLTLGTLGAGPALVMLYASYGVLSGVGIGMVYNANLSSVTTLFPGKSGLISGLLLMGFGLGSLIMGKLVLLLAGSMSFYPAFLCGAALTALTAFFGAPLFKPAEQPAGAAAAKTDSVRELTTGEMIKTPLFWLFFLWVVFMTSGGLIVINRAANIATIFGAAAILGMIVSVFNGVSRTFIGMFCDRFGSFVSMGVSNAMSLLAGACLLIAYFTNSKALMILGLVFAGVTYGCAMSLNAVVVREQFGNRNYPSNLSATTLSGILAAFVPFLSGALLDASGGDYLTSFITMIALSVLAGVMLTGILLSARRRDR